MIHQVVAHSMKTDIYLIRHGQPELQNSLLGLTDCDLTEFGKKQLSFLYDRSDEFDQVISSPLKRCANFSNSWHKKSQLPLSIDSAWKEYDFGDWDGLSYQELSEKHPQAFIQFTQQPAKYLPPNAECLMVFSQNLEKKILELAHQYSGKKIALITHAGVIRSLVAWCLQIDYQSGIQFQRFAVDYASTTHISIYQNEQNQSQDDFAQLISLNQASII